MCVRSCVLCVFCVCINVCLHVHLVCVFGGACVCACLEGLVVAGERKEVECGGICTRHPVHCSCCPTADILSGVYEGAQRATRR